MGILEKLFNSDVKQLETIKKQAYQVDALAQSTAALSDDELKAKTVEFRDRLSKGETLDDLMVEAFAVAREAAKRVIGEYPYLVQIMGGHRLASRRHRRNEDRGRQDLDLSFTGLPQCLDR